MSNRIANKLFRTTHVLHYERHPRIFAKSPRVMKKFNTRLWIGMFFFGGEFHAVHRKLFAGSGGDDKIKNESFLGLRARARNHNSIILVEHQYVSLDKPTTRGKNLWMLQVYANALMPACSKYFAPTKLTRAQVQHSHCSARLLAAYADSASFA